MNKITTYLSKHYYFYYMRKPTGFTLKNEEFLRSKMRNIKKLEESVSEKELRFMIYQLGCYAYREFFKAGIPADIKSPATTAPKMVWCKEAGKYVDERQLAVA